MTKKKDFPVVPITTFLKNAQRILKNPLPFHHENFEEQGDTFRLILGGGNSVVFSRDAAFAQYVLQKNQKNYTKSDIQTKDLAKYVGRGLLTAEGDHWRKQRRLIQPAFHKKQLAQLIQTMDEAICQALTKVKPNTKADIFPVFNDLAFETVVKALFSNAATPEEISRLQYITEAAQKMLVKELRQPYKAWWFKLSGSIKKHVGLTQEAREILKKIVATRKKSGERKDDLLDMLLDARYDDDTAMDDEQLIDEILILFTAGHETTSNALTFTTALLARHPEVQQRIYEEITQARATSTHLFEFLKACTYTQQVLDESMRLYPPAYFIDRVNLEDDEFEGVHIPKGTSLLFSMKEIHVHKEHWENSEQFDPERFSAENAKTHSSHYYPFGAGPRMCIGNNFAMYEMILAMAQLVEKYEIKKDTTAIEILPLITLKPKNAELTLVER